LCRSAIAWSGSCKRLVRSEGASASFMGPISTAFRGDRIAKMSNTGKRHGFKPTAQFENGPGAEGLPCLPRICPRGSQPCAGSVLPTIVDRTLDSKNAPGEMVAHAGLGSSTRALLYLRDRIVGKLVGRGPGEKPFGGGGPSKELLELPPGIRAHPERMSALNGGPCDFLCFAGHGLDCLLARAANLRPPGKGIRNPARQLVSTSTPETGQCTNVAAPFEPIQPRRARAVSLGQPGRGQVSVSVRPANIEGAAFKGKASGSGSVPTRARAAST